MHRTQQTQLVHLHTVVPLGVQVLWKRHKTHPWTAVEIQAPLSTTNNCGRKGHKKLSIPLHIPSSCRSPKHQWHDQSYVPLL
jgi:hypothetical protein